jgi:hypothetical protein
MTQKVDFFLLLCNEIEVWKKFHLWNDRSGEKSVLLMCGSYYSPDRVLRDESFSIWRVIAVGLWLDYLHQKTRTFLWFTLLVLYSITLFLQNIITARDQIYKIMDESLKLSLVKNLLKYENLQFYNFSDLTNFCHFLVPLGPFWSLFSLFFFLPRIERTLC